MSENEKAINAQNGPAAECERRGGWRLGLLEAVRVGAIVGLFAWAARMPFGFFHPDEDSWLFFYRYPPLWQLWVSLGISIAGAAVLFWVFSALRRAKGDGDNSQVLRAFRRVFSPVYFLLLGLVQLLPGSLNVLPVLPLLNEVILPVAVFCSVTLLFVVETKLFPGAFLDRLNRSVVAHRPRWTVILFLASLIVYGVFAARLNAGIGYSRGDEAHFLIQAESLAEDFDRDLVNQLPDYTHTRAYYYAKHLAETSAPGKAYSKHHIGLPLLLAPGWTVGKMGGAHGAMITISSVFAVTVFWIAFKVRQRLEFALGWWAVFCFTTPIVFYACRAYPEVPGGLLILVSVWKLGRSELLNQWAWLALGSLIGFLPWLQTNRLSIPAVLLSVWGTVWILVRGRKKQLAFFVLPLFVSAMLLVVLNQHWYGYSWDTPEGKSGFGKLDPAVWKGPYGAAKDLFRCWPGLIGGILHRFRGLLVSSPFYFLPMACVIVGLFFSKFKFWRSLWLWAFLVVYVPPFSSAQWTGGSCFPGRYMVSGLPLLVFPSAAVFARRRDRLLRAMFGIVAGFSIWMTVRMFVDPVVFFYGVGLAHWYSAALKLLAFLFPDVATSKFVGHIEDPFGLLLFMLWLAGVLGLIHSVKRKELSWHAAFNLAVAAVIALPIAASAIRRATGISPFNSVPADVLEHYSALTDVNRLPARRLHVTIWGEAGTEVLRRTLTLEYLAVHQKSKTGDVSEDSGTGQEIVAYDPSKQKPGYLSYTHPVKLQAGGYVVSFWLRVEDDRDTVILDVQDMGTAEVLASRRVSASDLKPREEFSPVPLRFSVSRLSKLSFRVYVDSKGKVQFLKYTLQPGCLEELVQSAEKSRSE